MQIKILLVLLILQTQETKQASKLHITSKSVMIDLSIYLFEGHLPLVISYNTQR